MVSKTEILKVMMLYNDYVTVKELHDDPLLKDKISRRALTQALLRMADGEHRLVDVRVSDHVGVRGKPPKEFKINLKGMEYESLKYKAGNEPKKPGVVQSLRDKNASFYAETRERWRQADEKEAEKEKKEAIADLIRWQKQKQANGSSLSDIATIFNAGVNAGQAQSTQQDAQYRQLTNQVNEDMLLYEIKSSKIRMKQSWDKIDEVKKEIDSVNLENEKAWPIFINEIKMGNDKENADLKRKLEESSTRHDKGIKRIKEMSKLIEERFSKRNNEDYVAPNVATFAESLIRPRNPLNTKVVLGQPVVQGILVYNNDVSPKEDDKEKGLLGFAPFQCPQCSKQMNVPYPLPLGTEGVKCPNCGTQTPVELQG